MRNLFSALIVLTLAACGGGMDPSPDAADVNPVDASPEAAPADGGPESATDAAPDTEIQYCQSGCWIDGHCSYDDVGCGTPACVACARPHNSCWFTVCNGACGEQPRPNHYACNEGGRPGVCQAGECVTAGLVPGAPCGADDSCGVPSLTCEAATRTCQRCGDEGQLACRLGPIVGDGTSRTPACLPWLRHDPATDRCVR